MSTTPGISAPGEIRLRIRDSWLDDNANNENAIADIVSMTPVAAFDTINIPRTGINAKFEPRGVSISAAIPDEGGSASYTATYSWIRGEYKSDRPGHPYRETHSLHITHPCRYRRIYAKGTTARNIIIKG